MFPRFHRLVLTAMLVLGTGSAMAQTQTNAKIAPDALRVLQELARSYRALNYYADQGEVTMAITANKTASRKKADKPMIFARPGKLHLAFNPVKYTTDGQTQTSVISLRYLTTGALQPLSTQALGSNPATVHYFSGVTGIPSMALFRLLTSDNAAQDILGGVASLSLDPASDVGGVPHNVLRLQPEAGPTVLLHINSRTRLLGRIEVIPSAEDIPPGVEIEEISWVPRQISTQPIPEATFQFKSDPELTQVSSLAELMVEADQPVPGQGLVGKPVPDFVAEVIPLEGEGSTLRKQDLAGKVVVIDFWATWCPPCMKELPEVAKLAEHYATGPNADRIRILALSVDQPEPGKKEADKEKDIPAEINKTIEREAINLRHGNVGLVAWDSSNSATTNFSIDAIPTLVVIGPDGIIRHVHVGYDPAISETLRREIDALLNP